MAQEEALNINFDENTKSLLNSDHLQCVFSGDIDGVFLQRDGGESTTELVCLVGGKSVNF